ncbi:MAG: hypothetical protein HY925_13295 [Elusimicrobia bacterium]|nr:hypothetical protein [Elusimicrobiota bacterium]
MAQALPANLPQPVKNGLEELARRLEPLVPAKLKGAVFYGGVAKGKGFSDSSDVNLLLVLPAGSTGALDAVAAPLREARRRSGAAPLVLGEDELERSMRAFPVKFYDICRHHQAWIGPDPLAGKSVPREWLRDNDRQVLADLSLRLKRLYVERGDPNALLEGLLDMISPAVVAFRPLLHEKALPVPDHREAVLESIAKAVGVSPLPLLRLMAIKKDRTTTGGDDPAALHRGLLDAVEAAAKALG